MTFGAKLILVLVYIVIVIVASSIYLVTRPTPTTLTPTITTTPTPILFATLQQSPPLIPSDISSFALFGTAVDITSDGNTVIAGGYGNAGNVGAAWIFVRSSDQNWSQQGLALIGSNAIGSANQGYSVAIASSESNTVLIGGPDDHTLSGIGFGALWIFTRTNQTWAQQGAKLVGSGNSGTPSQGWSVALSADGNTALSGGVNDMNHLGATWVFVRTNSSWSQLGNKLVGTGYSGPTVQQGYSVALSGDGNMALIGGYQDNNGIGATWIFVQTNQSWSQLGSKLVGTGCSGSQIYQGASVALSGDGNTAIIGGYGDNVLQGAAWIFVRSSNQTWNQQGNKLIASDGVTEDQFGTSVSLNENGTVALVSSPGANSGIGQFYVFVRSSNTSWNQEGSARVASGLTGTRPQFGQSLSISADSSTSVVGANRDGLTESGSIIVYV